MLLLQVCLCLFNKPFRRTEQFLMLADTCIPTVHHVWNGNSFVIISLEITFPFQIDNSIEIVHDKQYNTHRNYTLLLNKERGSTKYNFVFKQLYVQSRTNEQVQTEPMSHYIVAVLKNGNSPRIESFQNTVVRVFEDWDWRLRYNSSNLANRYSQ